MSGETRPCGSSPAIWASARLPPATSTRTTRDGRGFQDALVAIRLKTSLDGCEPERRGNDEFALQSPAAMVERFSDDPAAVTATLELAERLTFDLTEELGYRYPDFSDGSEPADAQLARLCRHAFEGSTGHSLQRAQARGRLDEELSLIADLGLSGFFLLHREVLELAREIAVEVRGRGSPRLSLPPGGGGAARSAPSSAT